MTAARLCIEEHVDPALALARGQLCWNACSPAQPVSLYAASLAGSALILGAHQHATQALSPQTLAAERVLRRSTGGATMLAREGVSYVALGLHERSALMSCPPQRILNRNVRGTLHGLRLAGTSAAYFGRDFISVEVRPAVYTAWQATADGRVLLEFFICESQLCWPAAEQLGYPTRSEDPFRGKSPITLQQAGARVHGAALLQEIAHGHAVAFGCEWQPLALTDAQCAQAEALAARQHDGATPDTLVWSALYEEAIGFVSAAVSLDTVRKLDSVRLAGDFFADDASHAALVRALRGVEPRPELIGRALDAVYAGGRHELEGVRSLQTFQEAMLDSLQRTRAAAAQRP
ncbi:MAG TPA: hypothetical protein VF331_07050 [Polyangiales bacterium]